MARRLAEYAINLVAQLALIVASACVVAGGWGTLAADPFEDRIPIGNKELICHRDGMDFRAILVTPAPIFGTRLRVPTDQEHTADESRWGRPNNWLRLPGIDFSLWCPFTASMAVIGLWMLARHFTAGRGFPLSEE